LAMCLFRVIVRISNSETLVPYATCMYSQLVKNQIWETNF